MAIKEFSGYSPACLEDINRRLAQIDAIPSEKIGQHFLINQGAIDMLAQTVNPGSTVIEVGSGSGHVTEHLAENASRLYGIEIDRRYRPLLDKITAARNNVEIIYGDALKVDFNRLLPRGRDAEGQVVASLPYHITEPFIQKVAPIRLVSVTLVVGRRYADSIAASVDSGEFGRLSILTATFFDAETLAHMGKDCFFPVPRTDSAIIQFIPRDIKEIGSSRRDTIFRHLFLTSRQNSTLRKGLKEGFDAFEQSRDGVGLSKRDQNRKARYNIRQRLREALERANRGYIDNEGQLDVSNSVSLVSRLSRNAIDRLNIPDMILDKPFALLNNSELRMLYATLE